MGRTTIPWFFLLLPLSVLSISNPPVLKAIRELADNNIDFGKKFPLHGLQLLYFLAQQTQNNNNNNQVIELRRIILNRGDYGFHRFANRDHLLLNLTNTIFYAFGNINTNRFSRARQLPSFVTENYQGNVNREQNRDRIVVQVNESDQQILMRVFISPHYIRAFEIDPLLLRDIRNTPREQFLLQAGQDCNARRHRRSVQECDTSKGLRLDVGSDDTDKARITWSGFPTNLTKNLFLKVYANMDSSTALDSYSVGQQQSGSIFTSVRQHPGLQVRLVESIRKDWLHNNRPFWIDEKILASPEFDGGNRKLPTDVFGYNASLQLFVKQGKACVRLYIKRSFTDWKNTFYNSWVGIYKSSDDEHSSYEAWQWQWAIYFDENQKRHTDGYLAYEYESGLDTHHDVQARFFLQRAYSSVRAHTQPWGKQVITKPTDVIGYDASLQLFAKRGKACARLYIKKSFTDWKDTFNFAWVGFYKHTDDGHRIFYRFQLVYDLKENPDKHTKTALAYEYESNSDIQHGVHVRLFFQGYTTLLAQTLPWGEEAIGEI